MQHWKRYSIFDFLNEHSGCCYLRYLVQEGCIPPLCDLLGSSDAKIVPVALDALDNILKVRCNDQ